MKNPFLWAALVLSLIAVSVSAEAPPPETPRLPVAAEPAKPRSRLNEPCEPLTGSHLSRRRLPDGSCELDPLGGRTYTAEDLQRTGQTDLREALKRLDPGIH